MYNDARNDVIPLISNYKKTTDCTEEQKDETTCGKILNMNKNVIPL